MDQDLGTHRLFGPARTLDGARPTFGRSMQVALAMKGGVSLAVWIGGAVAELDVFRRIRIVGSRDNPTALLLDDPAGETATPTEVRSRATAYAHLLVDRGYDGVEFDILAGASAGGLNAVLYSTAQRSGSAVDGVLSTWVDSGDIWKLLRPPSLSGVESVLRGDGYFWISVATALRTMLGRNRNPLHRVSRIVVDLSATVVDHDDPQTMGNEEHAGHFHFVADDDHAQEQLGRAIPEHLGDEQQIERLAYAARTTSSFPGAFEPALIWSHPVDEGDIDPARGDFPLDSQHSVDMSFAFHAQRDGGRPFRVIDGGVTDNIPIDRALRAVRDAPEGSFTDRVILYLEPDPAEESRSLTPSETIPPPAFVDAGRRRRDRTSRWVQTILSAVALRGIRESGPEKVAEVERYGRDLALQRGREVGYVPPSARDTWNHRDADAAYIRFRAVADYDHLSRVLADPSLWQLGTSISARRMRRTAPHEVYGQLDTVLRSRYTGATGSAANAAVLGGPQALLDGARVALSWVRELEETASTPARLKRLAGVRVELAAIAAEATAARDLVFWKMLDTPALDGSAPAAENIDPLVLADGIVDRWLTGNGSAGVTDLWRRLRTQRNGLARLNDGQGHWAGHPSQPGFRADDLAPYSAIRGIPETLPGLRFWSITAAEPAAVPFDPLRRAQLATVLEGWLRLPARNFAEAAVSGNLPAELDAGAKLAGSSLAHFGAFFSQDWRRNDWWWGRLDAAAGFVRLVGSLDPVRDDRTAGEDSIPASETSAAVQRSVLAQAATQGASSPFRPLRRGKGPVALDDRMTAGAHVITNLKPGYLLAIASRALRVVVRALGRRSSPISWVASRLLLPPVLVALPLIAHPVRAVVAVVLLLAAAAGVTTLTPLGPPDLSVPPNPDGSIPSVPTPSFVPPIGAPESESVWALIGPHLPAVMIAAVVVALIVRAIFGFARSCRRWSILKRLVLPAAYASEGVVRTVDDALRPRRRRSVAFAVAMLVFSVGFAGAATLFYLSDATLSPRLWIVTLAAVALALLSWSTSYRLRGSAVHARSTVVWVVVATITGIAGLVPAWAGWLSVALSTGWSGWILINLTEFARTISLSMTSSGSTHVPWTVPIVGGMCAVALAIVLGWGWLGGVLPTTRDGAAWFGMIGALLWLFAVAILTGAAALAAGVSVEAGLGYLGLFTQDPAVIIAAWFVGSHVFWWLGETPMSSFSRASDRPSYAEI